LDAGFAAFLAAFFTGFFVAVFFFVAIFIVLESIGSAWESHHSTPKLFRSQCSNEAPVG
jgi:hypothetical protein